MPNDMDLGADAERWAESFVETLRRNPGTADPHDKGFMIGWFANAIERALQAEREKALNREVIWQVAGAATGPLLKENPGYIFPSEKVVEAVNDCLESHGLGYLRERIPA